MNKKRIIALDVGDVRIGIAVSDATQTIAQPLCVYKRIGYRPDATHIKALCDQYETDIVLLGLPLHMDGRKGTQAEKVEAFAQVLSAQGLHILYQDERMSTVCAEDVLISGNIRRKERKEHVDKLAATFILEQWLAIQHNKGE